MKRTILLFLSLCAALCTGCTRGPEEIVPTDATPAYDSETGMPPETVVPDTIPPETNPSETEYISLPTHTIPPTYNNIREYAASPDAPDSLRELTGLPNGFGEVLVETGGLYCITYARDESTLAFCPLENEAALEEYMSAHLSNSGTYESLQTNDLVSDVRKTDLSTDGEILYECLYNTKIKTDLKLRYRECNIAGTRFVLSVSYDTDGSLQHCQMFVFAGDASFACISHAPLTDTELFSLRSIPLK